MKPKSTFSYFPISKDEQELLLRIRESNLADRVSELLEMVEQIAEAELTSSDVDQAIQLLVESRQGEDISARFDNLEARLRERIEVALAEIEGRLSKRLGAEAAAETKARVPAAPSPKPPTIPAPPPPPSVHVPADANVAFRVGDDIVSGKSAAQFYIALWSWLIEHGYVSKASLPIPGGKKRYMAAATPEHPGGNAFFRAGQPAPGIFVDTNMSRENIIQRAKKLLTRYGIAHQILVGGNS